MRSNSGQSTSKPRRPPLDLNTLSPEAAQKEEEKRVKNRARLKAHRKVIMLSFIAILAHAAARYRAKKRTLATQGFGTEGLVPHSVRGIPPANVEAGMVSHSVGMFPERVAAWSGQTGPEEGRPSKRFRGEDGQELAERSNDWLESKGAQVSAPQYGSSQIKFVPYQPVKKRFIPFPEMQPSPFSTSALRPAAVDQTHPFSGSSRTPMAQEFNQFGESSLQAVNRFISFQPAQSSPFSTSTIANFAMDQTHPSPDSSRSPMSNNDVNHIGESLRQFRQSSRQATNIQAMSCSDDDIPPTPLQRPPSAAALHVQAGARSLSLPLSPPSPPSPPHLASLTPQHALAALPDLGHADSSQQLPHTQQDDSLEAVFTPLPALAAASETRGTQTTHISRTVGVQVDSPPQAPVCIHLDPHTRVEMAIQVGEPSSKPTEPDQHALSGGSISSVEHLDLTVWEGRPLAPDIPTIQWPSGPKTGLPFYLGPNGKNVHAHDLAYIRKLVQDVRPADECSWVLRIQYNPAQSDLNLAAQINESLGKGQPVHITGYPMLPRPEDISMTAESIYNHFGFHPSRILTTLDAEARTRDSRRTHSRENYHFQMSIQEFCDHVQDVSIIRTILDAPSADGATPPFLKHIDHGFPGYYHSTSKDEYRTSIPFDVHQSRAWTLFHHGCFFTYPHYDSEAFNTLIHLKTGFKCWVFFRPGGLADCESRNQFKARMSAVNRGTDYVDGLERYVVYLREGDILIQPPGQVHEVYTPVPTISTGAHFYSYDSMHMTELVKMFDKATKSRGTNHHHDSALLTLQGMVNAMKGHPRQDFSKKGMSALCRMVTNPDDYFLTPFDNPDLYRKRVKERNGLSEKKVMTLIPEMDDALRAVKNAYALIKALGLQTPKHLTITNSKKVRVSNTPAPHAASDQSSPVGDDSPNDGGKGKGVLRNRDHLRSQATEQAKSPVNNASATEEDYDDYIFVDGYFNAGPTVNISGVTLQ